MVSHHRINRVLKQNYTPLRELEKNIDNLKHHAKTDALVSVQGANIHVINHSIILFGLSSIF